MMEPSAVLGVPKFYLDFESLSLGESATRRRAEPRSWDYALPAQISEDLFR